MIIRKVFAGKVLFDAIICVGKRFFAMAKMQAHSSAKFRFSQISAPSKFKGYFVIYPDALPKFSRSNASAINTLLQLVCLFEGKDEFSIKENERLSIAKEINISERSVDNALKDLVDKQLLIRISRSNFLINPLFIWKGKIPERNAQIKHLRALKYI